MEYIVGWVDSATDINESGQITGCFESSTCASFEEAINNAKEDIKTVPILKAGREVIIIPAADIYNEIITPLWSSRNGINVNTNKCIEHLTDWIKTYFEKNASPSHKAIIGISGGKDSSVAAALCVRALGKDRVFGVLMPQGEQADIDYSIKLVNHLGIDHTVINIGDTVSTLVKTIGNNLPMNDQIKINTPARIRMTTLYAVAASIGGRVVNTCNLSEDWVGYSTKFGDSAGDFSPLSHLTVTEIIQIGDALSLPYELVHKTPIDGLCGKSDEENLGFTYADLDRYIRGLTTLHDRPDIKEKIDRLHAANRHKLEPMPSFTEIC